MIFTNVNVFTVAAYLERQGRKCEITGASLIYDPQWEFTYACEIKYTAYP